MLKKILSFFRQRKNEEKNQISFIYKDEKLFVDIFLKNYETQNLDEMVNILSIFLTESGLSDTLTIMSSEFSKDNRYEEFKYILQKLSTLSQNISLELEDQNLVPYSKKPCISPSEMI